MTLYTITTQAHVRTAFWNAHPQFQRRRGMAQNGYPADIRVAFVDYVDSLTRSRDISERLAARVTL